MKCPSVLLGKTKKHSVGNSRYSFTSAVSQAVEKEGEQSTVPRKMFLMGKKVCSVLLCQHALRTKGNTTAFILALPLRWDAETESRLQDISISSGTSQVARRQPHQCKNRGMSF